MHMLVKKIGLVTLLAATTAALLGAEEIYGPSDSQSAPTRLLDKKVTSEMKTKEPMRSLEEGIHSGTIVYEERIGEVIQRIDEGKSYLEHLENVQEGEQPVDESQTTPASTNDNIRAELEMRHGQSAKQDNATQKLLEAFAQLSDSSTNITRSAWTMYGNPPFPNSPNFLGPLGAEPLKIGVKGEPAIRIIPTTFTPNILLGSQANFAGTEVIGSIIAGGGDNFFPNRVSSDYSAIGGGLNNQAGGDFRYLESPFATVSGGRNNLAKRRYSTVGGGMANKAEGLGSTIGGGQENMADEEFTTIAGGSKNAASDRYSTVAGGNFNKAAGKSSVVSGGQRNEASRLGATVAGGMNNEASGDFSSIPGGSFNVASGKNSVAAGTHAEARHEGTFVWSDSQKNSFTSSSENQFLIRAEGNVGIDTTKPKEKLTVAGNVAPASSSTHDLGSEKLKWKTLHLADGIETSGGLEVRSGKTVLMSIDGDGNLNLSGRIIAGSQKRSPLDLDPNDPVKRSSTKTDEPVVLAANALSIDTEFAGDVTGKADQLVIPEASIGAAKITPESLGAEQISNGSLGTEEIKNGSLTLSDVDQDDFDRAYFRKTGGHVSGTLTLPDDGLKVGKSQIVLRDGNVGIGIAQPQNALAVEGIVSSTKGFQLPDGSLLTAQPEGLSSNSLDDLRSTLKENILSEVETRINAIDQVDTNQLITSLRANMNELLQAQAPKNSTTIITNTIVQNLTDDEKEALVQDALKRTRETIEQWVANNPPTHTAVTNTIEKSLSEADRAAIIEAALKTVRDEGATWFPAPVMVETTITQVVTKGLDEADMKKIQSLIIAQIPQAPESPQAPSARVTAPIDPALSEAQLQILVSETRQQVLRSLKDERSKQPTVTNVVQQALPANTMAVLAETLQGHIESILPGMIPDATLITNIVERRLNPEEVQALGEQFRAGISDEIKSLMPEPTASSISQEERGALIAEVQAQLKPLLDELKVPAVKNTFITNQVVQTMSDEEKQALVDRAIKASDTQLRSVIQNTVAKFTSSEINLSHLEKLEQRLLKATEEKIGKSIASLPPSPKPFGAKEQQRLKETVMGEAQNAIKHALKSMPEGEMRMVEVPLSEEKQLQMVELITATLTEQIPSMIPTPQITKESVTNILVKSLSADEQNALAEKIKADLSQSIKGMIPAPVVTENFVTNIIERGITDAERTDLLAQGAEQVHKLVPTLIPQPIIQHTAVTNVIVKQLDQAEQDALSAAIRTQLENKLAELIPPPQIQHTAVTNTIVKALDASEKAALVEEVRAELSKTLESLIPAPQVNNHYSTNTIVKEISESERALLQANIMEAVHAAIDGGTGKAAGTMAVVSGGAENAATANAATVGGGFQNSASAPFTTIAGGANNNATEKFATIAGGNGNLASGVASSINGGRDNQAAGAYSTVVAGRDNLAKGHYSLSAGRQAKAVHDGAFVWADATGSELQSQQPHEFRVRASGGVNLLSNPQGSSGATLHPGAVSWSVPVTTAQMVGAQPVSGINILAKLSKLPLKQYNLTSQNSDVKHIGPSAEDFYATFGLGESAGSINSADQSGVTMAAVQALYQVTLQQQQIMTAQQDETEALKARIAELESFINQLKRYAAEQ